LEPKVLDKSKEPTDNGNILGTWWWVLLKKPVNFTLDQIKVTQHPNKWLIIMPLPFKMTSIRMINYQYTKLETH
jgi:hypothetical protein